VGQADTPSRFDSEWLDEARDPLDSRVGHLGVLSVNVDPSLVIERDGVATAPATVHERRFASSRRNPGRAAPVLLVTKVRLPMIFDPRVS
jgi:hypothetical protein